MPEIRALMARLTGAVTLFVLAFTSPVTAQEAAWRATLEQLETQLAQDVERDSVGSIVAAVVDGGRVVWVHGFGWADRDRRIRADANTIYRVGSITKSFTAVALVQAAERGVLALDDPAERYLPEVSGFTGKPEGTPPITLRQLASHTAGLIREPELRGAAAGPIGEWEAKIVASIPTTRFQTVPGERYSYSNIGFGVLGLTVSRAAKVPFMELVARHILEPLGMRSSGFVLTPEMRAHLATGYANRRDGTIDAETPAREHDGRGYKVPNGGLYATASDLARFIAAMCGSSEPPILSAASRTEMLRLQTPAERESGYGLGFSISTQDGVTLAGHGGSVSGYNAHIAFEPESCIGVILLRNYGSGATSLSGTANRTVRTLVAERRSNGK